MTIIECVHDQKALLGEGPCWHDNKLFWIDIEGRVLYAYNPQDGSHQQWHTGERIGTIAPKESGDWLIALQSGIASLNIETGAITAHCNPEPQLPHNRFNDGKCDPAGRFFAGTMPTGEGADGGTGTLYLFDHDLSYQPMRQAVACSNGLAWTADHSTMYYIDTPTMQVDAYDYDITTSAISNPRAVVTFTEGMGYPDGMTIDREGMIWVAQWEGWGVSRFNPKTGACLQKIDIPCAQVTACTFGGENLDQLYITTAKIDLDENEITNKQPQAGGLFRVQTDTQGYAPFVFKG